MKKDVITLNNWELEMLKTQSMLEIMNNYLQAELMRKRGYTNMIKHIILCVMLMGVTMGVTLSIDGTGRIYFDQPVRVEINIPEEIEVEVNDRYNVYEDYLSDELREQQKDINEYWEKDYRDYLRGWGVDENLMRGW